MSLKDYDLDVHPCPDPECNREFLTREAMLGHLTSSECKGDECYDSRLHGNGDHHG